MDTNTLAVFVHELRNQCLYTETALDLFNQARQQKAPTAMFFATQATLTSASHIANLLWPPRARSKSRGEQLRKVLQLPDKHPLNDRRITALWEHADEKAEACIVRTRGMQIAMDYIGPKSALAPQEILDENLYRVLDTDTAVFYYRGDGFDLQAIARAIADISNRVAAVHQKLFPQQPQPGTAQPATAEQPAAEGKSKKTPARKPVAKKAPVRKKTSAAKKPVAAKKAPATKKSATKKPAVKKKAPVTKKPAAKKPAAKKPVTKKSVAKKTAPKKAAPKKTTTTAKKPKGK